jgi:site-specific DNA recombinase
MPSGWNGDARGLAERIDLGSDHITTTLNLAPLTGEPVPLIRHTMAMCMKHRGVEMRLVLDGKGNTAHKPDPALIKAVVRAHKWFDDLVTGRAQSLAAIARAESVSDRYVAHLLRLAFLAPDIVVAILAGTQPTELTAETLTKRTDLPLDWAEQKALLGFD